MKTLIIIAHPNPQDSLCGSIATSLYKRHSLEGEVRVIDLYDKQWRTDLYSLKPKDDAVMKKSQKWITWSEHIIFVHPLWWGSMPAPMKHFLDMNFSKGVAFAHERPSWLPRRLYFIPTHRLLKGKKSSVWITGDGQFWVYLIMLMPFFIIWALFVMVYTGLRPVGLHYIGGVRMRSDENIANLLEKIETPRSQN